MTCFNCHRPHWGPRIRAGAKWVHQMMWRTYMLEVDCTADPRVASDRMTTGECLLSGGHAMHNGVCDRCGRADPRVEGNP